MSIRIPKPFLKWPGGKRSLLKKLTADLPDFDSYCEPMIGGGALFFELAHRGLLEGKPTRISDANEILIDTYKAVRDNPEGLLKSLRRHRLRYEAEGEAYYYRIRKQFNQDPTPAQLIFLNKTGFNGLYRVNRSGGYNVPHGDHKSPHIADYGAIRTASAVLQATNISWNDKGWTVDLGPIRENGLVYVDPPYFGTFRDYTNYRGGEYDFHFGIATMANVMRERGMHVMISNSDHPKVRELFNEENWRIESVKGGRNISRESSGRKPADDLLIRSW